MGQLNTITNYITQLLTQHVGQFTYAVARVFLRWIWKVHDVRAPGACLLLGTFDKQGALP